MSEAEKYTLDSIALLGYLADKLPGKVDSIFERAEGEKVLLIIPSIAVGETVFTLLKAREVFGVRVPVEKVTALLDVLERSRAMRVVDLLTEGWRIVTQIELPELHDRMIVATHKLERSKAILTDDEEIARLKDVRTIWR